MGRIETIEDTSMKEVIVTVFAICLFVNAAVAQNAVAQNAIVDRSPRTNTPGAATPADENSDTYLIGPEDVLSINVWKEPEFTSPKVVVRPDGKIGVPLLNDIQASGQTPRQLQERITTGLKKYVSEPNVSVIVLEIRSQAVHIIGSVAKPGLYMLGGPMTVVELLARAGGLTEFAKSENIQIVRKEKGKTNRWLFNYKKFTDGSNFEQNIALQPGDIVTVP
jgi:polysaccharide biosynthesis/export protein